MDNPAPANLRELWRQDLRVRILGVALLPLLIATALLSAYFANQEIGATWDRLDSRGAEIAARLAQTASFDLFAGNEDYLHRLLDQERVTQGCATIAISDRFGHWRLVSGETDHLPVPREPAKPVSWQAGGRIYFLSPISLENVPESDPYLDYGAPSQQVSVGQVLVALKTEPIESARRQILLVTIGIASVLLLAAGWVAWRLSLALSRPLQQIIGAVRSVAGGDTAVRVIDTSPGELGELERGINLMIGSMASHSKDLAQKVDAATSELRAQKQAAEAAVMARSRFLAAASHDLRQPMHALILLVEALKEKLRATDGEPFKLVEHIDASAQSMKSLLNVLLDISKLDAGVVVARPECFDVNDVFKRLEQQFEPLAVQKGVMLRIVPSRIGVFTDPLLLERILANLLANAIRYTDRGGIVLGLRRVQQDWVRIEVWDSGRGIPDAFQEKVFEEYFQLENPERDRDKGLGLGLAIVQRLARLLGSPVDVRSKLGRGSCFSLRLLRCEQPSAIELDERDARKQAEPAARSSALVAFVDDDETILEAMMMVFEQWGIDLAVGADAYQLKEELLELGRKPAAILSDYRLRDGRNGIEAIAELRAAFGADIPALLITGDTAASTIQAIANSGLPVLHKPLKPAMLRSYLNHMLAGTPQS